MDEQGNIHYINGEPFHLELININEDGNIIDLFGWQVRLLIFDINNNTVKEITEADFDVSVPGTLIISQTANHVYNLIHIYTSEYSMANTPTLKVNYLLPIIKNQMII
jgi:hypothetical protein